MSNLKSLPAPTLLTFLKESYFPPVISQCKLPRIFFPLIRSKFSFILCMYVCMCMLRKEDWSAAFFLHYFPHTEILKHNKNRANTVKSKHSLPKSNSTGGINTFYNVCTLSFCSVQTFILFQNIIFLKGCSQSSPLLQMRQKLLT